MDTMFCLQRPWASHAPRSEQQSLSVWQLREYTFTNYLVEKDLLLIPFSSYYSFASIYLLTNGWVVYGTGFKTTFTIDLPDFNKADKMELAKADNELFLEIENR